MAEPNLVETKHDFPTCCAAGGDVYPAECTEHGAQVPADLLSGAPEVNAGAGVVG